jgi:hypothetical protein
MAQLVEFVTGTWVEGLDEETCREAEALSRVMTGGTFDALLALIMFEQAHAVRRDFGKDEWDRERERERVREEELAADDPRDFGAPDYMEWRLRISEQARRDIMREKGERRELLRDELLALRFGEGRRPRERAAHLPAAGRDRAGRRAARLTAGEPSESTSLPV